MIPQVGHTITWKSAQGNIKHMVVALVHEVDGQRWMMSAEDDSGNWTAVNQRWVLGMK